MTSAMGNARWVGLSQCARVVTQLISLGVLARLLPPSDYGLMAMAGVVTNFASLLRDLGLSAAVIQKKDLNDATISTVFWLNMIMGVVIAVVLITGSPMVAEAFRMQALVPVLCALAIVFPVTSSAAAHQALLERHSSFKTIARIEIVSVSLALLVAIAAAWNGLGVYSLVLQAIVNAVLSTVQLWLASRWWPKLIWSQTEFKGLLGFSGNLTVFNFINYFSRNADSMIIGRLLGAATLGAYSMAYRLMLFPLQNLTSVATRALFPVLSRKQDAVDEMGRLYLRSIGLITLITAPLMIGLFVLREPFVNFAFGPNWGLVAGILAWLAPVGLIQSVVSTTGIVFMARGRTDLHMRLGLLSAVLQVGAFLLGARYGVLGVAGFYFLANLLNAIPALFMTLRLLGMSLMHLLDAMTAPIAGALVMAAVLAIVIEVFPQTGSWGHIGLFFHIAIGALVYLISVVYLFRQNLSDLKALLLPGSLRPGFKAPEQELAFAQHGKGPSCS